MQNYHKELTQNEIKQFVIERFEDVKKNKKAKELVEFQAMNKFLIMAHNQEQLKILGRIVASYKKIKIGDILAEIHPIIFRFNKTYLASQTYFLLYANPEKGNIFKSLK